MEDNTKRIHMKAKQQEENGVRQIWGAEAPRSALEEVPETCKGARVLELRSRSPNPNRLESQEIDPGRVSSLGMYGTRA